jgi:hypothetical protein
MVRYIVIALAFSTMVLTGCALEEAAPESDTQELNTERYYDGYMTILPVGPETVGLPEIAWSETEEDQLEGEGEDCRVDLNYCVDPNTGGPTCSQTGCSWWEFIYHCQVLICRVCGC